MSVIIAASVIDTSIIKLSVFTGGLTPSLNIAIFSVLVAIYAAGQYLILVFIKRKIELIRIPLVSVIHKLLTILQYVVIAVLVIIILKMVFTSSYDLFLLKVYGLIM